MKKEDVQGLLSFYKEKGRDLPWRKTSDPYSIYVSEVLLQQTRVEAIKDRYPLFLARFPDIRSLASCEEEELLKMWEGLGYYRRAKNLYKSAKVIAENYEGKIPDTYEALTSLPGIGEYTAKAILSIAYQKKEIALDGNLLRVYSRITEDEEEIQKPGIRKRSISFFLENIPDRPGDYNQALMDLGELVCLPNGVPKCEICPFLSSCKAHQDHREIDFPKVQKKKEKKVEQITVLLFTCQGKRYLEKRPDDGLLASLYQPYLVLGHKEEEEIRSLLNKKGITIQSLQKGKEKKHIFSHVIWEMQSYAIEVKEPFSGLWVNEEELKRYSIPIAFSSFYQ